MRIQKLTSLIIEPTNTCNLRCSFCFVTEGMSRPDGFMDLDLFKKVVDGCPELEHLCMHNWGEPLLHPDLFAMLDHAHSAGVRWLVMNTNGTLLNRDRIRRIVDSPLSILRFSIDGSAETFRRVRGVELANIRRNILRLKKEKEARRPELSLGVVFTVEEDTWADAADYIAEWEDVVDHVRLQPKLIDGPRREPCPELFGRDYGKLVVLWDGTVIPCCVDYNAELKLGNAGETPVGELWRAAEMERLRRQHKEGRFPSRCAHCQECETPVTSKRFFFPEAAMDPS
ncbi:MAG: radical SAM/SPASM domain-containing protein [Nitrospinaceae bacterium]